MSGYADGTYIPMFDLTGRTAIITGGNGGIGLGIALGLATSGADIVICGRNPAKTTKAVETIERLGGKAFGVSVDVADEQSIKNMVAFTIEKLGHVNILVNNAGIGIRKRPEEYSVAEWKKVIDINLTGAFVCSKEVYPYLVQSGGGKVINVGSMTSLFGSDWASAYSASKGGIIQLTKSLAVAWANQNIQVNAILPGWIHTDLTAPIKIGFPDRYESIRSRIPHGRWGEPDEMAGAAIFLSSAASNYVTGASIPVDGGYTSF